MQCKFKRTLSADSVEFEGDEKSERIKIPKHCLFLMHLMAKNEKKKKKGKRAKYNLLKLILSPKTTVFWNIESMSSVFLLTLTNTAHRKRKSFTIWYHLWHCTTGISHFFSLCLLPKITSFLLQKNNAQLWLRWFCHEGRKGTAVFLAKFLGLHDWGFKKALLPTGLYIFNIYMALFPVCSVWCIVPAPLTLAFLAVSSFWIWKHVHHTKPGLRITVKTCLNKIPHPAHLLPKKDGLCCIFCTWYLLMR